jgi:hypothetical protein
MFTITDEAGEREFESGLMAILVGFLPSITARKPIAARNKTAKVSRPTKKPAGLKRRQCSLRIGTGSKWTITSL